MYKIIGDDGRPYGPVTAEQLREYIAQRRANAQTMTQLEGATEWKPLSAFPEFAEALAAQAPPTSPSPPPMAAGAGAQGLAAEVINRGYTLDIGSYLSRAWQLLQSDFWPIVGVNALLWLLVWASSGTAVGLILIGPLMAGIYWYCLKRIRHQPADVQDAFGGFTIDFINTMLAGIITGLLISVGLALCIVPGIFLWVAWAFALPLVIDKRLQFWDAMEVSRKVVTEHWWGFFGLGVVTFLINLVGFLFCVVGLFLTLPLTTLAWMYAYEDVFGAKTA